MGKFDQNSNYNKEANFTQVKIGEQMPILEVELNEMQQIQEEAKKDLIRDIIHSGFIRSGDMSFNAGVVTFTGDNIVYLDGMRVVIPTGLQFNIPYSTPTKDVLVFIEAWYEEVTSTSAIKKYGGADQANIANTLLDSRMGFETSHRVQLKWRLRAQDNLDFASGFNFNDMIYPIAGNTPPTVVGQAAYKYISLANTANKFGKIDKNLYMSGDVTNIPNSKTLMKSVDGMAYMIPVMAIRYSSGSTVTDLRPLTAVPTGVDFDAHTATMANTSVAGHVKAGDGIASTNGTLSIDVGQGMQLLGTSPNKTLSPVFTTSGGDNGSANTVARGDHAHDGRYFTEAELGSTASGSSGSSKVGTPSGTFGTTNLEATITAIKAYIDLMMQGLSSKQPVRVATTANITRLGVQTIDGVTLVANDRILVKDQTQLQENGIYIVASGAWARATDSDTSAKVLSSLVLVTEGTVNKDCSFLMTTDAPITLGTTGLNWVQFSGAGQLIAGQGITKSGNTLSIADGVITDALIGNRTITDTGFPSSNTGTLNVLLNALAAMIKKITGGNNYYSTPPATLTDAKNHIDAGSPHNNHARSLSFNGDVRGATWSRILSMTNSASNILGNCFLLHISHTRGSVVYSATFLITASHPQKANIIQLANTTYTNFKIRAVVKTSGDGYIELYDDAQGATASTVIAPFIHVINLNSATLAGTLTGITTFTDGTTLDADTIVGHEITTVSGNKIIADLVGSASKLNGQDPAYYLSFANMTGKPTTRSGYGITDAAPDGFGLGYVGKRLVTGTDLNTVTNNGWYDVNSPINGPTDLSATWQSILTIVSGDTKYVTQLAFDMTNTTGNMMWIRKSHSSGLVWTPWERVLNKTYSDTLYAPGGYGLGGVAKDVTGNWNSYVSTGFYKGTNLTNSPPYIDGRHNTGKYWYVMVQAHSSVYVSQLAIEFLSGDMYIRTQSNGTWTVWKKSISRGDIGDMGGASYLNGVDLNTVYSSGMYRTNPTCTNIPDEGFGNAFLLVMGDAVNSCTQIINSYGEGDTARTAYRSAVAGSWSPWKIIGSENYSLVNTDGSIKSPGTTDFNSMTNTGFYALSGSGYTNGPTSSAYGALQVMVSGLAVTQIYYRNINEIYTRMRDDGGTWSEWKQSVTYGLIKNDGSGLAADDIDMNNYTKSGFYFVQFSNPTNGPGGGMYGILHVMSENTSSSSNVKQMFYPRNGYPIYRTKQVSSWSAWDTVMTQSLSDAYYFPKTTPLPLVSGGNSAGMHYRDVANYNSNTSAITGVLKIKLPKSWSNTMLDLVIKGHTHGGTGSGAWELRLSGYNYNTTTPIWQQVSAVLNREAPFTQVRFAHDGTNCCILLGTLTTVWQYPKILISEVMASFTGQTGWDTGWVISVITSETGITSITSIDASRFNQTYALTAPNGDATPAGIVDLNTVTSAGSWSLNGTGYTNGPSSALYGTLHVVRRSSTSLSQTFYADGGEILTRSLTNTTWSAWSTIQRFPLTNADGTGKAPGTNNFDLMLTPGQYTIDGACDNNPRQGTNARGVLDIKKLSTGRIIQEFTYDQDYIGSTGGCKYIRSYSGSVWSSWVESIDGNSTMQKYPLTNYDGLPLYSIPGGSDMNNFIDTGNYGLSGGSFTNAPAVTMYGILEVQRRVISGAGESTVQRITLTDSGRVYTRTKHGNSWTAWRKIMNDTDDFAANKSYNGYQKLPSGVIIQWGSLSLTPTTVYGVMTTVTFPIAFPTGCQSIIASPKTSDPLMVGAKVSRNTVYDFDVYAIRTDGNTPISINWFAIGY